MLPTGPHGVGKTTLIEALAEFTQSPLLLVRLTELGLEPSHFDQNLSELMSLSSRWGAILAMYCALTY